MAAHRHLAARHWPARRGLNHGPSRGRSLSFVDLIVFPPPDIGGGLAAHAFDQSAKSVSTHRTFLRALVGWRHDPRYRPAMGRDGVAVTVLDATEQSRKSPVGFRRRYKFIHVDPTEK
jgi:hypothetical protein